MLGAEGLAQLARALGLSFGLIGTLRQLGAGSADVPLHVAAEFG
ncbi:hypothetical protein SBI_09861 [Streptomyces bingchenggensis BCW-1]|uniref:Uncharacterized protein n=1 Tax=Streptomyces bingchenggensis (strain BCW-1) TaxID=749414 RepID=D7CDD7_STRBB|nr:hypothetical protein SBI_09861 [Streptomyces bingchenggensis BCW-1]